MTRRALLSVSDKTGIRELGRALADRGFELLSTGGTANDLRAAGLPVIDVAEVTGHPEIMEGRVKTLHPAVHGPLLARRDVAGDMEALAEHGYQAIDVVAVNLYPFRETIAKGGVSVADAMKKVDIGGPTMIRAAAKNHASVWVVVDPADYARVIEALDAEPKGDGPDALALRRELARKVFEHISTYDAAVAGFLAEQTAQPLDGTVTAPAALNLDYERVSALRYGENPDQAAAFYAPAGKARRGIASLEQHHGKELSYNNLLDLDGALLSLSPFALSLPPAVCIVKHTTPCGLALGDSVESAYRRAFRTDPVSAFGSVIATNREVDEAAARAMGELFVECVVAPGFSEGGLGVLTQKKNIRVLTFPDGAGKGRSLPVSQDDLEVFDAAVGHDAGAMRAARFLAAHGLEPEPFVLRGIYGGLLAQSPPVPPFFGISDPAWKVVTKREPTVAEAADLAFAWSAVYGIKSNAILLAKDGATLGIGAGQMSRVDSSRLAVQKAADHKLSLEGCALASDAFFPFADGVEAAAAAGVRAIIQPGGSVRDQDVIAAADAAGIAMIFTGRRLFRH
jgi:phosphoribosylaminoimidazolecarboxamide formyltransferase/IMP cyclohydrolase